MLTVYPAEYSSFLLRSGFGPLRPVLGPALPAVGNTLSVQSTAHDVVAATGQVLNSPAADKHNAVFLQVVAFARDISGNFNLVRELDTSYFAQS